MIETRPGDTAGRAHLPAHLDAVLKEGRSALSREEAEKMLSCFAQVLAREPHRTDVLNDCGVVHGRLGQREEAIRFFRRALAVEPERTDVLNNMGLALGCLGRHREAIAYLSRALALRPDYLDALCNLGYSLVQLERYDEALGPLGRAVAIERTHTGALCNRGIALAALKRHAQALDCFCEVLRLDAAHVSSLANGAASLIVLRRFDEALEWLERALRLDPSHTGALSNRGAVLSHLGRHAEAIECFNRSLLLSASRSRALVTQATALERMGREAEALERIERALDLEPDLLEGWLERGVILLKQMRVEEALACFDKILQRDPRHLAALNSRAVALSKMRNHSAALACLDEALKVQPDDFRTLVNRGIALDKLLRFEEAIASYDRALAQAPDSIDALIGRCATLFKIYRLEDAEECVDKLLTQTPDSVEALNTRGAILWHYNRNAEARACLERALSLEPGHINATNNLSFVDLAEGELIKGFQGQEVRWQTEHFEGQQVRSAAPLWLGKESLEGKTILVTVEQGHGDTFQFVRYASLLAQRGATVFLGAPKSSAELLASVPGVGRVLVDGSIMPPYDFHCPMMSLPLAFGTTLETIPADVPYIHADPERVEEWRERLGAHRRPRIGLVWAGRQYFPINVPRDMSLRLLLPLLELEADFISLQKDVPEADRALLESLPQLAPLGGALEDFSDTAALVAALDLVIAVDTAIVHLAGAMGKPVWIMNRFASCWRWLRDGRTDSPWYPSVRLFRQASRGDWQGVVRDVKRAAESFIAQWSAPAVPESCLRVGGPSNASLMRRAAAFARQGKAEEAVACYTQIVMRQPDHVEALCALGTTLGENGYHAEALVCFDRGLALSAGSAELITNRGAALLASGSVQEALLCFDRALSIDPHNIPARFNRGLALSRGGKHRQALVSFDEVLSMDAGHAAARFERSMIYLRLGNFRDGFRELESRWQAPALQHRALKTRAPLWLGGTSLAGRTILLHHEQGFGDGIQLARYIPKVAALAGRVLLGAPPELQALFRSSFEALGNVEVLPVTNALPAHDCHCPMMSLPLAFDTQPETIPAAVPYLRASADRIEAWREWLGPRDRLRVGLGLAWREHISGADVERTMQMGDLSPLLEVEVDFFNLPVDGADPEEAMLKRLPGVRRPQERLRDFADAAALIESLDLVISIDTAVAHLSGALGKPVWILLPRVASWRWMESRDDSPWYPSARLFRQGGQGGWPAVLTEVVAALKNLVSGTVCPETIVPQRQRPQPESQDADPSAGELYQLLPELQERPKVLTADDAARRPTQSKRAPREDAISRLLGQGAVLYRQRDYARALECFERALGEAPDDILALDSAGESLGCLGRPAEALSYFDRLLQLEPCHREVLHHRGLALLKLGRLMEALECYDLLFLRDPDHVAGLSARAFVLNRLDRHEDALESTDRALRLDARCVGALINRCVALERLNRPQEALACIEEALIIKPNQFEALVGRGAVLQQLDRLGEARVCYEAALALRPNHVDALFNRSFVHLAQGNLPQGFKDYEARWRTQLARSRELETPAPKWLGETALDGKRILVYAEQGLGDSIQLCRYLPLLAGRGAELILRVPQALEKLMRSLACRVDLVTDTDPLPPHDLHCPMMSLPFALGTTLESIPAEIPYLSADPERCAYWQMRLGPAVRPRVGLVWAGHLGPPTNLARDMPLKVLLPLLDLDAQFVSLQKEIPAADRALLSSLSRLANHGEELVDFADCAGLIANLDLIVSVDTSVPHLAGALGKPVWIMNRFSPCWRWLRGRDDSPWYPTARLFRQSAFGDWEGVVRDVHQAASAFIASQPARTKP